MKFSLNKFLQIADVVAGPVLIAFGVPIAMVPVVHHAIRQTEIASAKRDVPLTGPEKRAAVIEAVSTAVAGVNAVKPGALSPIEIPETVGKGIDVVIDTINIIGKNGKTNG